jgi:hypothetical protein
VIFFFACGEVTFENPIAAGDLCFIYAMPFHHSFLIDYQCQTGSSSREIVYPSKLYVIIGASGL